MANKAALRTEFLNLLTSTSNATATEKTKLRNRFVTEYNSQWLDFADGQDTAALRGEFVAFMIVEHLSSTYTAGSSRENTAAIPPAETF